MNGHQPERSRLLRRDKSSERRISARAVSRGVAIGTIVCVHGQNRQFYRIDLADSAVDAEIKRLNDAISTSLEQLSKLASSNDQKLAAISGIFDTHKMLLADPEFVEELANEIVSQKINAEWAIKLVSERHISTYKALEDEHLRDRYVDLEDVLERVLNALGGSRKNDRFPKNAIFAALEMKPSTIVEMAESKPKGLITENGGWTSHTFILAREMNWPAVTGVSSIMRRIKTGDRVIVDGYNGHVIVNPDPETLERYKVAEAQFESIRFQGSSSAVGPAVTLDGTAIKILANSDLPETMEFSVELGAQGVGLYRSEYIYSQLRRYPTEDEQVKAYGQVADQAGDEGVKIRLFDLDSAQLLEHRAVIERNPALGLRAIRLGLEDPFQLGTQLRAILRASHGRNADIVIPMVSGVTEVLEIRRHLENAKRELEEANVQYGEPRLGVMVELPSAVFVVDDLVEVTDFICLGTNDLIQYLLAADRDNEAVSDWFRTLHPAVLKAIRTIVEACNSKGKPVIVCGEMAGSPYYVPILLGLGASALSMNVLSLQRVRRMISGIEIADCRELVDELLRLKTVEEVEDAAHKYICTKWSHLFPFDVLNLPQQ